MDIVNFLSPTNIAEEKRRFFASDANNPIFKYNWLDTEAKEWVGKPDNKYKDLIGAILKQDHPKITFLAEKHFSTKIDDETLARAQLIIKNKPNLPPKASIEEIKIEFEKAFRYFELKYQFEISDEHGFNFRPKTNERKIIASRHAKLTYFSVDGEVKHELTHIIRKENGELNGVEKSLDYLPTEEGLASYLQDYSSDYGDASLFQHAAEYVITDIGIKSSLREMFNYLLEIGFDEELAWQRAIRHKFGFIDTNQPGDIMKPSMYFYNEQKIKQLTDGEKLRLMVGKISVSELERYLNYKGLIPSEKIIHFYKLKV